MTVTTPSSEACAARPGHASARPGALGDGLFVVCGLAWAAGAIHLAAAAEHSGEHPAHAVLLLLVASTQVLWGVVLQRSPSRRLLRAGAIVSLALVALWTLSRTSGIPIGAAAWRPESVGLLDSVATADAAALAVLAGLGLRLDPRGRASR